MIDWDRYWKFWDRYGKRMDRRHKQQQEEQRQVFTNAVMEILQDFGPLTPSEIAGYLAERGYQYASAYGVVKYVLSRDLVDQARQGSNGRWSLIPTSSPEAQ